MQIPWPDAPIEWVACVFLLTTSHDMEVGWAGEAVGSLYKKKREDARDHARLRNVFFEQVRPTYNGH